MLILHDLIHKKKERKCTWYMLISDYFPLYAAENASMNSTGHEDSIDRREVKMKLWHLSNNLKILTPRFAEVP